MPKKKQSPQPDATKPTAKAPHGSKSAFVRALPAELSAKEVVNKAKAEGIKLSIAQVYNIRSTSRRNGSLKSTARAEKRAASTTTLAAPDSEVRLRRLIAEVGLARSRQVLAEVGAAFAG